MISLGNLRIALYACVLGSATWSSEVRAADEAELKKAVNVLINAIRYQKDDLAAKQLDFEAMVAHLLSDQWAALSPTDQTFFKEGMETLIRGISFTAGRNQFKYLDAISYGESKTEGNEAQLPSTIVIDHPVKGRSSTKIIWVFHQRGSGWKLFDTVILGESTLDAIREDQVEVLLKEGGIARVKEAMTKKIMEIRS